VIHILSQLDPMVWMMMVVVAVGFVVSALVLVELLPRETEDTQVRAQQLRPEASDAQPADHPSLPDAPEGVASTRS